MKSRVNMTQKMLNFSTRAIDARVVSMDHMHMYAHLVLLHYELRRSLITQNVRNSRASGENTQKFQFDVLIKKFQNTVFDLPLL